MPVTCTRRIQFCAGHRVFRHEGKCAHLHGHNYVAYITAEADRLDSVGRVIDFSVLKDLVGGWIEKHWDHGFILAEVDLAAIEAVSKIVPQKLYLMKSNPTAENIANHLLHDIAPKLLKQYGVIVTKVVIDETENCSAEACISNPASPFPDTTI
mgnify:CR=1 FL=1